MTARTGRTDLVLTLEGARLEGELVIPTDAVGVVAFAHGSGSSRFSPRNRLIAEILHGQRVGTLLFDLLTEAESRDRANVFDVDLLARRLVGAVDWLAGQPETSGLPIGLFGASTGAAAALIAAAERADQVLAVVSRGGRVDLAEPRLNEVRAHTLFIVGEADREVVRLNRRAFGALRCPKHMVLVPHATHLFEEPGTLEEVARHAAAWFGSHLASPSPVHP